MTLIIKSLGTKAPEGAKKLYRDALVEDGTLLMVDFSNRGTLKNFDVSNGSKVYNLARESSDPKGVEVESEIRLVEDFPIQLSNGKGFTLDVPERVAGYPQGLFFEAGELMDYLTNNQPHSMWVGWMRVSEDATFMASRMIDTINQEGGDLSNFSAILTVGGNFNAKFGGSGVGFQAPIGELFQFAFEAIPGQPSRTFLNGIEIGQDIPAAFLPAEDFMFGSTRNNTVSTSALYRTFIEDLSVSGRSAEEVIEKDWDYVYAMGEYEGIEQRPFVKHF